MVLKFQNEVPLYKKDENMSYFKINGSISLPIMKNMTDNTWIIPIDGVESKIVSYPDYENNRVLYRVFQ